MYIVPSRMKRLNTWAYTFPEISLLRREHVVKVEPIKYLGKYMTICLIHSCEKEAIYTWQNSILTFYISTFFREKYSLNSREGVHFDSSTAQPDTPANGVLVLIAVAHASDW